MSTAFAPHEIAYVALTVHDLAGMAAFYQTGLGLDVLTRDASVCRLGAGGHVMIELQKDPAARRSTAQEAGLFHTAFLLPDRAALALWLRHAAETGLRLQGASDHGVSEAIYLADPEGNGIEVYADRSRVGWYGPDGAIKMGTESLDLQALVRSARGPWSGAPEGTVVGHVHLQVGALPKAEAFWRDTLGLAVMARYPGAAFFGSGGYHHHIATNIWNSRGAGPRSFPSTGLAELVLAVDDQTRNAILAKGGADKMTDPWGLPVTLRPKA
jgi:catechol 2,3-dioxygenase